MSRLTRREAIQSGLGALAVGATGIGQAQTCDSSGREFTFHHDHILGTSLDLWVTASAADAFAAERLILDEMDRCCRIFSPFDPTSEVNQLNRSKGPFPASRDLLWVLRGYDDFGKMSRGACSAHLGGLTQLWTEAQRRGSEPSRAALAEMVDRIAASSWRIRGRSVTRQGNEPLDLCSLAKGYAIAQALEVVRRHVPGISQLVLNLGGDIAVLGEYLIAVQNPHRPEENARPLTAVRLFNRSIATSGGYQRYYLLDDRRHSHLLDPRTGRPADGVASATVVAPDSVAANALATVLCILDPEQGIELVNEMVDTECLLVLPNGSQLRSDGFSALEAVAEDEKPKAKSDKKAKEKEAETPWPADYQVSFALEIPTITGGRRYRRPYVAIWIENADGKGVRSVTVWGNAPRWLPTMSEWWKLGKNDRALVKTVTRATRAPGKYTVVWDGKDDAGKALPQGTYTVRVEVHREHGKHLFQSGKIECRKEEATLTLAKNAETGDTIVTYAKRK